MFSQRNNPYCELISNCIQIYKKKSTYEKNIRIRLRNQLYWLGISK